MNTRSIQTIVLAAALAILAHFFLPAGALAMRTPCCCTGDACTCCCCSRGRRRTVRISCSYRQLLQPATVPAAAAPTPTAGMAPPAPLLQSSKRNGTYSIMPPSRTAPATPFSAAPWRLPTNHRPARSNTSIFSTGPSLFKDKKLTLLSFCGIFSTKI